MKQINGKLVEDSGEAQLVIVGGTGKTREVTFGDVIVFDYKETNETKRKKLSFFPIGQSREPDVVWDQYISNQNWKASLKARYLQNLKGKPSDFLSTRHSSCYIDGKVWIWGGSASFPPVKVDHMITLDVESKVWTKITNYKGTPPSARSDHCSTAIGKNIFIFGGSDSDVIPQGDLHVFNTETLTWSQPRTKGTPPSPRSGHVCASIGTKIYIFGGAQWSAKANEWLSKSNELFILDTKTMEWSKPPVIGTPPDVSTFPAAFAFGRHIWILGGGTLTGGFVSEKCWIFDTISLKWETPVLVGDAFRARDCVSVSIVGNKAMLFGGYRGDPVNDFQIIEMPWSKLMQHCGLKLSDDR